MSLLTELGACSGPAFYKHGAPNGAVGRSRIPLETAKNLSKRVSRVLSIAEAAPRAFGSLLRLRCLPGALVFLDDLRLSLARHFLVVAEGFGVDAAATAFAK